jgi:hypothetical protein
MAGWEVDSILAVSGQVYPGIQAERCTRATLFIAFPSKPSNENPGRALYQTGLSLQKSVSRYPDRFAGIHFMQHYSFSVKAAFYVFLHDFISYVTSGQTIMWKMTVH